MRWNKMDIIHYSKFAKLLIKVLFRIIESISIKVEKMIEEEEETIIKVEKVGMIVKAGEKVGMIVKVEMIETIVKAEEKVVVKAEEKVEMIVKVETIVKVEIEKKYIFPIILYLIKMMIYNNNKNKL